MKGPAAPAFAVLVTLVVVLADMVAGLGVPSEAYAGLVLVMTGSAAVAWSDEGRRR